MKFGDRLMHAWNALMTRDPTPYYESRGIGYGDRPDRVHFRYGSEKGIVTTIYTKIAVEVSNIKIQHVRTDEDGVYQETILGPLNDCLTVEANKDQSGKELIRDAVLTMFDDGYMAIVPVDTDINPILNNTYKIYSLRVANIIEWYPDDIRIRIYDDRTGQKVERVVPKRIAAIVENPFYSIMNEPNSTAKRLVEKMNLLDKLDNQTGSKKLDLIIQLPYTTRSEVKKEQAEKRKKEIEFQLTQSPFGIAYIDATEKVTQLNRSVENNLLEQVQYLAKELQIQMGMLPGVMDGTADEKTMLRYNNETILPILTTIIDSMSRKFLTKTARTQGQTIMYFNNLFKLVPISELAPAMETFTRNEILSSNEARSVLGYKPSKDKRADELRNKNLNASNDQLPQSLANDKVVEEKGKE